MLNWVTIRLLSNMKHEKNLKYSVYRSVKVLIKSGHFTLFLLFYTILASYWFLPTYSYKGASEP